MRRTMTAIVTAAALLVTAGPMVAQESDQTNERTQPDARSLAPQDGLTIYGTVTELDEDQLTLETTTGVEHLQIVPQTAYPVNLEPGSDVAVDYNRNAQGIMIANQIRLDTGEVVTEQAEVETEIEPAPTTATAEVEDREIDVETEAGLEAEAETEVAAVPEPETAQTDELPATAGDLPLIALLGLIGFAGAGALHVLRS